MKKAIGLLAFICAMALLGGCDSGSDVAVYYESEAGEERPEASDFEEEDETTQSEKVPIQESAALEDGAQEPVPDPAQTQTTEAVTEAAPAMEETPDAEPTPEENTDIPKDAPLGIPVLSDWAKTYDSAEDPNPMGDGVTFTITWSGVDGANGYEAEITSQSDTDTEPHVQTETMTDPVCEKSFSHIYMNMKIKVRAYKETEAGRQYGDWSAEKEMSYSPGF